MRNLFFLVAVLIASGLVSVSCSDSKDDGGNAVSGDTTYGVNSNAENVIMFYGVGGGDLDYDMEADFARAANTMTSGSGKNVRCFVQYKYSGEEGYKITTEKQLQFNPMYVYNMSGDFGCVYRFELSFDMLNPNIFRDSRIEFNDGTRAFKDLNGYKIADKDFKMYDPQHLAEFIRYCMQQAPQAKVFALVLADHGGSYSIPYDYPKTRGVMYDDNLNKSCMSPMETAEALRMLSQEERSRVQLLLYDCCLMNNLEVIGELKDVVPYMLASGHSVPGGDYGMLVSHMNSASQVGVAKALSPFVTDLLEQQRIIFLNGGKRNDVYRNLDYTLTDMSKVNAMFAALKEITDFLCTQDVSDVATYKSAASQCYQYFNRFPYYDVISYLSNLQEGPFHDSTEFDNLLNKFMATIKDAQVAHADYCYSLSEEKGESEALTYSITIGFNSDQLDFSLMRDQSKKPTSSHIAIMNYQKAGNGTNKDPYYNEAVLDNGDMYGYGWINAANAPLSINMMYSYDGNHPEYAFDRTYKQTVFDKQVGWSRWMQRNPGIPEKNPPYNDDNDYVGDYDEEKPEYLVE